MKNLTTLVDAYSDVVTKLIMEDILDRTSLEIFKRDVFENKKIGKGFALALLKLDASDYPVHVMDLEMNDLCKKLKAKYKHEFEKSY